MRESLKLKDAFDEEGFGPERFLVVDRTGDMPEATVWVWYNGKLDTSVALDRDAAKSLRNYLNDFLGDK